MPLTEEQETILRRAIRRPLWDHGTATRPVGMGRPEIERLIPHRAPLLLVDRITAVDPGQHALEGKRRISPDDPVFQGHFPGQPVYPGMFLLEMMGQFGLCLYRIEKVHTAIEEADAADLSNVRLFRVLSSLFAAPVLPRDELTVRVLLLEESGPTFSFAGQVSRGETVCAVGLMEVYRG